MTKGAKMGLTFLVAVLVGCIGSWLLAVSCWECPKLYRDNEPQCKACCYGNCSRDQVEACLRECPRQWEL